MKLFCILLASSLAAINLVSCASGPPSYEQNIQSAISGRGNVVVRYLDTGVVQLTGWVEDTYSLMAVQRAAAKGDHVLKVINLIYVPPKKH